MADKHSGRFSMLPARAVDDRRLLADVSALRVLMVIATYSDRDGWCWPAQTTIADRVGKSRRLVQKCIASLVEWQYLESKPRITEDGSNNTNLYRVLYDPILSPEVDMSAGAKPNGKVPEPETKTNNEWQYRMAIALAEAVGMDFKLNRARLLGEAKRLKDYTAEQVKECFQPREGLWYRLDWRGKRGSKPTISQIGQEIAQLLSAAEQEQESTGAIY